MFQCTLGTLKALRKLQALREKRTAELNDIYRHVKRIDAENDKYIEEAQLCNVEAGETPYSLDETALCDRTLNIGRVVEERNEARAVMIKREEDIYLEQENEAVDELRVMALLFPMLEAVFEKAGILLNEANPDETSLMRLERFDNPTERAIQGSMNIMETNVVPDSLAPNTIDELRNKLIAQSQIAERVEIEFDEFRETSLPFRTIFLGIGPILLGRTFDHVVQPSLPLFLGHVLTYTSCI
jgi:hypothetical protein